MPFIKKYANIFIMQPPQGQNLNKIYNNFTDY